METCALSRRYSWHLFASAAAISESSERASVDSNFFRSLGLQRFFFSLVSRLYEGGWLVGSGLRFFSERLIELLLLMLRSRMRGSKRFICAAGDWIVGL